MNMRKMMIGCMAVVAANVILPAQGAVICSGESAAIRVNSPVPDMVDRALTIYASPWAGAGESVTVDVDGTCVFSTTNQTETAWHWQPLMLGNHTLTCTFGTNVLTKTLNVTALDFFAAPVISPADGATFSVDSCTVTITCATAGATIYYSTNGRTPRFTDANRYNGPFTITDTTTVIAVAALGDQKEYAEATITKVEAPQLTLSGVLDAANLTSVTTGGDAEWEPVESTDAKVGGSYAQSGTVGMEQSSCLEASVNGKGTLTFWWKVSCEPDPRGRHSYDNLSFAVDGTDVAWIDGETGWAQQSVTFDTDGTHTVRWTYSTDDWEEPGYSDCGWVDGVVWTPEGGVVVDPLPEIASDSEVTNALAGAGDEARLTAHISDKVQYDLFRAWVDAKGLDHQAVKDSPRAWFSYAIGANELIERDFQSGDVEIDSIEAPADGVFTFKVRVKNAPIGIDATSANLATVFEVQGSPCLAVDSFSSTNVNAVLDVSSDGQLIISAMPIGDFGAFFVRVRMYADEEIGGGGDVVVDPVGTTFLVTFAANGGEGGWSRQMDYGDTIVPPTVTRTGYTFTGWVPEVAVMVPASNVTYMAQWAEVDTHAKVQLWEGGPYWATTNIGAENPEDDGYYFWWGDTVGYKYENDAWVASDGSSSNFSFGESNTPTYGKDIATLQSEGWITADSILALEHDAAHVHWGGDWRMPTKQEFSDLVSKCVWTWTTLNGVNGYVVKGKGTYASASIFLPCVGVGVGTSLDAADSNGYFWSWSSVPGSDGNDAWSLYFYSSYHGTVSFYRSLGQSVRPVQGFATSTMSTVTLDRQGGSGGSESVSTTYGKAMPSITVPTRSGYTFGGYYTETNGSGTQYYTASGASARDWDKTSDTTLYAHWTATPHVDTHAKVQLWEGGPYWATTNIGAENPEDAGYYFWWGDTVGYKYENDAWVASDGSSSNFSFGESNMPTNDKDIATLQSEGWITADSVLAPEHDAAHIHWGGDWRMPTKQEISDLVSKCDWTWTTLNGVQGYIVKGNGAYASASIFLPAAGRGDEDDGSGYGMLYNAGWHGIYWSSVPTSGDYTDDAGYTLDFFGSSDHGMGLCDRDCGQSVRPVQGLAVTFDANGGSGGTTRTVLPGAFVGTLPTPTREGYTFDGWFTEANGGTQVSAATIVSAAAIYYAHWTATPHVDTHAKVQLWEGGPYWATTNIGAENPEDDGYYFWWGDTVGYKRENDSWVASDDSSSNFSFSESNTPTYGKDIATLQSEGWITADEVLVPEHDAAHVHWGGDWRMPTNQELDDLSSKCVWTFTTVNGVQGYVVTGKGAYADRSIFLPAVGDGTSSNLYDSGSRGYYWSSTPHSGTSRSAWTLYFGSSYFHRSYSSRCCGRSVRPVRGFAMNTETTVTLDRQGGSGGTASVTATYGSAMPAITVPTRSGYTFGGYYTETNGSGTQYYTASGASARDWDKTSDTTLYAHWTATPHVDTHAKVQLWEGGPYWATTNIGAENPEDAGYYFWWGDTVGYKRENNAWIATDGSSSNFLFSSRATPTYNKDVATLQSEGWITADGVLAPEHDAAHVHWGGDWRMPTDAEFSALISNCTTTWTTRNGVYGRLVTGKGAYADRSIFLPAVGYGDASYLYYSGSGGSYWSSTPDSGNSYNAWYLGFNSSDFGRDYANRDYGLSVRPVRGFAE